MLVRGAHNFWENESKDSRERMNERRALFIAILIQAGFSTQEMDVQWGKDDHISNLGYNSTEGRVLFEEVKQER